MAEAKVKVAGTTVNQEKLERIFTALIGHGEHPHWFGIRAGYTPRLERFKPIDDVTACPEQIVYTYMAMGTFPEWFKEQFVWDKPNTTVTRLF